MSISYIEITTRCNMRCAHCCVDAKEHGIVMSQKTFEATLDYVKRALQETSEMYITVGGGEPTLHRHFMQWIKQLVNIPFELNETSRFKYMMGVSVITNGTRPKVIKRFRDLMEIVNDRDDNKLTMSLSTDPWHDYSMVSP